MRVNAPLTFWWHHCIMDFGRHPKPTLTIKILLRRFAPSDENKFGKGFSSSRSFGCTGTGPRRIHGQVEVLGCRLCS